MELLEKLAAIEHDQWVTWAKTILETENISPERVARWKTFFIPYEELSEEVKEFDREWARKVLEAIGTTKYATFDDMPGHRYFGSVVCGVAVCNWSGPVDDFDSHPHRSF